MFSYTRQSLWPAGTGRWFCSLAPVALSLFAAPAFATEPGGQSWNGCYVGANAGYARAGADATDSPFRDGPFAGSGFSWNGGAGEYETIKSHDGGLTGGVEAGCDRQIDLGGTPLVIGGVVDFSAMNLEATGTSAIVGDTHTRAGIDWAASFRARAGLGAGDVLFFVSGGVAVADVDVRAFDKEVLPTFGRMNVSGGGTETGWVAGAGAEWRVKPNLSLSLEYLHYDFGSVTATGPAIEPVGAFPRFENDVRLDTVRIGLKWRM